MAIIHIQDSFLANRLASLATNTLKCILIDISTFNDATDTVASNLTEVSGTGYTAGGCAVTAVVTPGASSTSVTYTPAGWATGSTISATGAAIIDTSDGNKIVAIDDFQGVVASSGGTYTVAPITTGFTHF